MGHDHCLGPPHQVLLSPVLYSKTCSAAWQPQTGSLFLRGLKMGVTTKCTNSKAQSCPDSVAAAPLPRLAGFHVLCDLRVVLRPL